MSGHDRVDPASVRFLGGVRTVTGSRFLVDARGHRTLVDCGLFQGVKADRLRNWQPFPVPPASIDTVVLTHAHIDHSGYLPALVRDGFSGRIVCTADTAALVEILLADAAHLEEEEARFANRAGYSKHAPALPLFTREDARRVTPLLAPAELSIPTDIGGATAELRWAGHILGSASVLLTVESSARPLRLFVSGDVGRPSHPLLAPPEPPPAELDAVLVESTYGDRHHAPADAEMQRLAAVVSETAARGGTIVIPAFAVDRTEVVLDALRRLADAGRIPDLPIFVDSPMALSVLGLYRRAIEQGHAGVRADAIGTDPFDLHGVTECRTTEESMALAELRYPSIIISASGMATGGRVLHHLERLLPDPRNAVIFTGFQADGTRGRRLVDGERAIKMFGRYVPVRAHVMVAESFSVHADDDELVTWLGSSRTEPSCCYVVHGAESSSTALAERIGARLGWTAVVPQFMEKVLLDPGPMRG